MCNISVSNGRTIASSRNSIAVIGSIGVLVIGIVCAVCVHVFFNGLGRDLFGLAIGAMVSFTASAITYARFRQRDRIEILDDQPLIVVYKRDGWHAETHTHSRDAMQVRIVPCEIIGFRSYRWSGFALIIMINASVIFVLGLDKRRESLCTVASNLPPMLGTRFVGSGAGIRGYLPY